MNRMQLTFDGLKQYKPGEIIDETKEIQAGFNNEVSNTNTREEGRGREREGGRDRDGWRERKKVVCNREMCVHGY